MLHVCMRELCWSTIAPSTNHTSGRNVLFALFGVSTALMRATNPKEVTHPNLSWFAAMVIWCILVGHLPAVGHELRAAPEHECSMLTKELLRMDQTCLYCIYIYIDITLTSSHIQCTYYNTVQYAICCCLQQPDDSCSLNPTAQDTLVCARWYS